MTDQQSRAGRNAGIVAGVAVLLAAGAAGFVWWEGTVFDATFADFGKRLADEGSRTGLTVTAEETDRGFAHRGMALTVQSSGVSLRWTGRADFGVGTRAVLHFDPEWGSAPELAKEGLEGLSDELRVTADVFGRDVRYDWTLKPFRVHGEDGLFCRAEGMTLRGTADFREADFHWDGMTCEAGAEQLTIGKTDTRYRADAKGETFSLTAETGDLGFRGPDESLEAKTLRLTASGTPAKKAAGQTAQSSAKAAADTNDTQERIFDLGYGFELAGVTLDGVKALDSTAVKLRLLGVSESFAAAVTADSAAGDTFAVLDRVGQAFREEGLVLELDEARLVRDGHRADIAGRMAKDAARLGAFSVTVDPKIAAGLPYAEFGLLTLQQEGWLKETEGRLTSHIELREDGILINGQLL